jgi:hypothetical protein
VSFFIKFGGFFYGKIGIILGEMGHFHQILGFFMENSAFYVFFMEKSVFYGEMANFHQTCEKINTKTSFF